jgi:glycosyltransferase involved in cell wall biosynthesis
MVVAGGGEEQRYRAMARELGVQDAIHWLGVTRAVEVVYEMADAFVLPTSYESFSLVSFEAAASALPVLATPVSGVRELIRDGQSGFLISQEPSVIAARLGELAADPALRKRLGEAARHAALAFDTARMIAEHDVLYQQLTGAQLSGRAVAGA